MSALYTKIDVNFMKALRLYTGFGPNTCLLFAVCRMDNPNMFSTSLRNSVKHYVN
jgi:hypothetical protein